MSSSDRGRGTTPNEPAATAKTPGSADAADPYSNWLDRMQRARVRHAAITKNLYTWSNYKSWAEKMKDTWQDDPARPAGGSPVTAHPPKPPIKK